MHAHPLSLHLPSRAKLWKLYHITSVSEDHKKSFQNVQYILLKQFPQKINIAIKNAEYDSDFESFGKAAINFASIKDTVISKNFTSIFYAGYVHCAID